MRGYKNCMLLTKRATAFHLIVGVVITDTYFNNSVSIATNRTDFPGEMLGILLHRLFSG